MTLQVIGAGFGRTGTTSLKAALERLGFAKCHHMKEVMSGGGQVGYWQTLADGGSVDWDEVFEGYQASCDWPSCTYWEELAEHYPDAKIILSVRDEQRWYDSVAATIYPGSFLFPNWFVRLIPRLQRYNRMVIDSVWDGVFDGRFLEREHALQVYRDHNARVRAGVDPERLLVFEARDGWEPLCRFLDVPIPSGEYPHLNDANVIKRGILAVRILGWLAVAAGVAGAIGLAVWLLGGSSSP